MGAGTDFLLVGLGGAAGSMARYGVALAATRWGSFPVGTLLVNIGGCAAIGVLGYLSLGGGVMRAETRLLLITGLLGGLTTFSTFGLDTFLLAREGRWGAAGCYVAVSVLVSLSAVWAGWTAARVLG
ncbi:MAG: fluoride efflux transporter CrcB [Phycisphaerales bacterium]|nr:fluoride efflux transporter CrcB [Phycisphaerales bacterium]